MRRTLWTVIALLSLAGLGCDGERPCESAHDCEFGEWCVDSICVASCRTDGECPGGWQCIEHVCVEYRDEDNDGYTTDNGDCDDENPQVRPGQLELPYDGADNDCDPTTLDDDLDQDGFPVSLDCDDEDEAVRPGVPEIPYDGVDNDCNPYSRDMDADRDGVDRDDDCDDREPRRYPGALDLCGDGYDQDCDGMDLTCGAGSWCNKSTGLCEVDPTCARDGAIDGECPLGQRCDVESGRCTVDSSCAHGGGAEGSCPEGRFCQESTGVCVADPSCNLGGAVDGVCPAGERCVSTTGRCEVDSTCGAGGAVDGDCPSGEICVATTGLCEVDPSCAHGGAIEGECPAGTVCTPESGRCDVDRSCAHGGAVDGDCEDGDECVPDLGLCLSLYDIDHDGDGFTEMQGDCDDGDSEARPGGREVCGDNVDNDCLDGDSFCVPPEGMACLPGFCITRHEASRGDATESTAGADDDGAPQFVSGALPWTDVNAAGAAAACARLGWRLCRVDEWERACDGVEGEGGRIYAYGDSYLPDACNTEEFSSVPTGSRVGCVTPEGVYDLTGNVAEWAGSAASSAAAIGGDYGAGLLATCGVIGDERRSAGYANVGFRCCLSADDDHDGDGWGRASDCDDTSAAVHPGRDERCNAIDDNCDGAVDEGFDNDGDGWPSCYDCNDNLVAVHPCQDDPAGDGVDQDCDGGSGTVDPDAAGRPCFASCEELQSTIVLPKDGTHYLDPDGPGENPAFRVYCDGMESGSPRAYLPLVETDGTANYSYYVSDTWAGYWSVSCAWERVRLSSLSPLRVDGGDTTYASCLGAVDHSDALSWGTAGSCECARCATGFMSIDLTGTGLMVDIGGGVEWATTGINAVGAMLVDSPVGLRMAAEGGGFCGEFGPVDPPGLQLTFAP